MCHPETCFRLAFCVVLKNEPFWNMVQIGTGCANFVVLKLHVKCKVLKHKYVCKETKSKTKPLHLFIFSNEHRASSNAWVKRHIVVCSWYDVCTAPIWSMFQNATFFSERHTMPIWNMFQDGTCFRMAGNACNDSNVSSKVFLFKQFFFSLYILYIRKFVNICKNVIKKYFSCIYLKCFITQV